MMELRWMEGPFYLEDLDNRYWLLYDSHLFDFVNRFYFLEKIIKHFWDDGITI